MFRNLSDRLYIVGALPFLVAVVAVNLVHPMIHGFEGGTLDMVLDYVDALAAQIAQSLTHR